MAKEAIVQIRMDSEKKKKISLLHDRILLYTVRFIATDHTSVSHGIAVVFHHPERIPGCAAART